MRTERKAPAPVVRATSEPKPKRGKGSAVLIRVTQETRDALDTAAGRTGRSLSQTAEKWLEEAIDGRAGVEQLVGGHDLVGVILKLGDIRRRIDQLALSDELKRLALN